MRSKKSEKLFKSYDPNQLMLLPPSLSELIPSSHPVRVLSHIIDQIDLENLISSYEGGGAPSYHPKLLLKVLIYGYVTNIYSSRKLESACRENIHFMWLSGMQQPDHSTINRFRSGKLKKTLKEIFGKIVQFLSSEGVIDIKKVFVDGTKIEANANKYTFVWGRAIKTSKSRIAKQLNQIWAYAEDVAKEEMSENQLPSMEEINSESVSKTIQDIDKALKNKKIDKKVRAKLTRVKKAWPKMLDKYDQQQQILKQRNSYSKTDPDATFMRMKDDHMQNGQLKAGYNWQLSSNNQFVVNYSIHQNPTDSNTLKGHLNSYYQLYGKHPKELVADAGYGSEENYQHLENQKIDSYVKFNTFHKEGTKAFTKKLSKKEHLFYNKDKDCYYCPIGQPMRNIGQIENKTKTGYKQTYTLYQATNCNNCSLRSSCHKSKQNRTIQVNHNLERHRKLARNKLKSPKGIANRSQRPQDVESVFGNIKQNKGFRRFMLRGIDKVEIEIGLLCIAHNISKAAKKAS